jgi:hypothetical protein
MASRLALDPRPFHPARACLDLVMILLGVLLALLLVQPGG